LAPPKYDQDVLEGVLNMSYLRFHRSMKIIPGVRLNMSKSGPSVSLGVPGARLNIGTQGVRTTVGIPGTGASIIDRKSWKSLEEKETARQTFEEARDKTFVVDRRTWKKLQDQEASRRVFAEQYGADDVVAVAGVGEADTGAIEVTIVPVAHRKSVVAVLGIYALGAVALMIVGTAMGMAFGSIGGVIAIIAIGWPTLMTAAKYMP
jgi:hypothetical protein